MASSPGDIVTASLASSSSAQHAHAAAPPGSAPPDRVAPPVPPPSASACGLGLGLDAEERHPRARRKRTGPEDKKILEVAYQQDSKPDKQARLALVERVSLSEKEVQIWFQNRRQNDRRKSRPLTAEDIAAMRPVGQYLGLGQVDRQASLSGLSESSCSDSNESCQYQSSLGSSHDHVQASQGLPSQADQTSAGTTPPQSTPHNEESSSQDSAGGSTTSTPWPLPSPIGYLANRWNLGSSVSSAYSHRWAPHGSFLSGSARGGSSGRASTWSNPRRDDKVDRAAAGRAHDGPQDSSNREEAHMRLSLSLQGKAELVPKTPRHLHSIRLPASADPPPLNLGRARGLQRSRSAYSAPTRLALARPTTSAVPAAHLRLVRGRSSDVRAWESCAGYDVHDDLTDHAVAEASGSALVEIARARLQPQRRALQSLGPRAGSNPKRRAPMSSTNLSLGSKKAKMTRTTSSVGRLESSAAKRPLDDAKANLRLFPLYSGVDSDKENVSPDEDGEVPASRRHPLPDAGPRAASQARRRQRLSAGHRVPPWLQGRSHTAPAGRLPPGGQRSDADEPPADQDAEVAQFMATAISDSSPGKERDWNCARSLLSLSQREPQR